MFFNAIIPIYKDLKNETKGNTCKIVRKIYIYNWCVLPLLQHYSLHLHIFYYVHSFATSKIPQSAMRHIFLGLSLYVSWSSNIFNVFIPSIT